MAYIRIESTGVSSGTKVVHVDDDGTETDLSRIVTGVEWDCSVANGKAKAEIKTLPARIVARLNPDFVRFLPEPDPEEFGT